MLGKIEGRRRRGGQDETIGWHHRLNGPEFEQARGDHGGQRNLTFHAAVHGVTKSQTQQSDWTAKIFSSFSSSNILVPVV